MGLLKAGYRTAADLLDKVAGFLNAFFQWGVRDDRVYLHTVWYEKGNVFNPAVEDVLQRNAYARGIFDLAQDWTDTQGLERMRKVRHALTHRYVPVYIDPNALGGDHREQAISREEIHRSAWNMLRTARAAVIGAVGAADVERRQRENDAKGRLERAANFHIAPPQNVADVDEMQKNHDPNR